MAGSAGHSQRAERGRCDRLRPQEARAVKRVLKLKKGKPFVVKGKATVRVVRKPRRSKEDLGAHALEVFSRLKTAHPDAHCELDHETSLQLLIATILSAQCTDKRVNMVTPLVFRTFPTATS